MSRAHPARYTGPSSTLAALELGVFPDYLF